MFVVLSMPTIQAYLDDPTLRKCFRFTAGPILFMGADLFVSKKIPLKGDQGCKRCKDKETHK